MFKWSDINYHICLNISRVSGQLKPELQWPSFRGYLGIVSILKDGGTFNLLKEIPLDDICLTAPSITDGMIYFRTQKYLFAVGKK